MYCMCLADHDTFFVVVYSTVATKFNCPKCQRKTSQRSQSQKSFWAVVLIFTFTGNLVTNLFQIYNHFLPHTNAMLMNVLQRFFLFVLQQIITRTGNATF